MCLVTRLNGYDGRMVCYSYQFTWHVVTWFNNIRRGTTAKFTYLKPSILQNKENEFKSVIPINLAKLTRLTVGASIACWTPAFVWVWSSHTLTTIVTRMKSNTEICLQLTVLSTVREHMYRLKCPVKESVGSNLLIPHSTIAIHMWISLKYILK